MPVFGNQNIGLENGWTADYIIACKFTCTEAGAATKISAYLNPYGTGQGKCALYADSAGAPGALLATGTEFEFSLQGWHDSTISYALEAGVVYWLAVLTNVIFWSFEAAGDTNQAAYRVGQTYPTFPNPFTQTGAYNSILTIYCSYTATTYKDQTINAQVSFTDHSDTNLQVLPTLTGLNDQNISELPRFTVNLDNNISGIPSFKQYLDSYISLYPVLTDYGEQNIRVTPSGKLVKKLILEIIEDNLSVDVSKKSLSLSVSEKNLDLVAKHRP